MKNNTLFYITFLIPLVCFGAPDVPNDTPEQKASRMKILADLGLPLPDSGIKLVPRALMNLPPEVLEKGNFEQEQLTKQGYVEDMSTYPSELLNFKSHAALEFKQFSNNKSETSTHVRPNVNEIKLGFLPKSLPKSLITNYIGAAPEGGFHNEGWSQVAQFFEKKGVGVCVYSQNNLKISHAAAELAIEGVDYTVNNKPTISIIRGSKKSGFIYRIKWYDDENFHELECASMKYSPKANSIVIEVAKEIDKIQ